jgi:hypothetical protein
VWLEGLGVVDVSIHGKDCPTFLIPVLALLHSLVMQRDGFLPTKFSGRDG